MLYSEYVVHRRSAKSCSEKFLKIHRKATILEYFLNKIADPYAASVFKKRIQHRCFPKTFAKIFTTTFSQNFPRQLRLCITFIVILNMLSIVLFCCFLIFQLILLLILLLPLFWNLKESEIFGFFYFYCNGNSLWEFRKKTGPCIVNELNINRIFKTLSIKNSAESVWSVCWTLCEKCPNKEFFCGPYFPVFGLNTEIYEVNLHIQSEHGKIRTRKNSVFGHFSHSGSPCA